MVCQRHTRANSDLGLASALARIGQFAHLCSSGVLGIVCSFRAISVLGEILHLQYSSLVVVVSYPERGTQGGIFSQGYGDK